MLNMVNLLEDTQKKWQQAMEENNRLKAEIKRLETEVVSVPSSTSNKCSNAEESNTDSADNKTERKKRRSSTIFRRSLSLPARNELQTTSDDVEEDCDCYYKVTKRKKCSQKFNENILNDAVSDRCPSAMSSNTDSNSEQIDTIFDSKPHNFVTKRNFIRSVCGHCDCYIRFGVMFAKCLRCKGTFHNSCRKKAPLPCIARTETPKTNANGKCRRLRLGDYCPDSRPMIPPLIAYCVHFLDKKQTSDELYQNLGSDFEVESITKIFNASKNYPKLEGFSVLSVAGCIRKFLAEIREPVIPYSYSKEFISAALAGDINAFPKIVNDLPTAHMDTLACLCKHWRHFLDTRNNKTLTTSFYDHISSVVFDVRRNTLPPGNQQNQINISQKNASLALKYLIDLPVVFWTEILNSRTSDNLRTHTPILRNPSNRSTVSMKTTILPENGRCSQLIFESMDKSFKEN